MRYGFLRNSAVCGQVWLALGLLGLVASGCGGLDEAAQDQRVGAVPAGQTAGPGQPARSTRTTESGLVPEAAAVRQVLVSPAAPKLARGLTLQFRATAILTDGSSLDVTSLAAWSVRDTRGSDVASIDSSGLASADNVGQARVAARYSLTTGAALLEVTPAVPTGLLVTPPAATLAKGTTIALTASAQYSDGTLQDVTGTVSWSVRDVMGSGVASIDAMGRVQALAAGLADARAELAGLNQSARLTVTSAVPTGLAIRPADPVISKGLTQRFLLQASFSDGTVQDVSASATWRADDLMGFAVARIDSSGLAVGDRVGKARIVGNFRGLAASTTLEVKAAIPISLALSPMVARVAKGRVARYQAILSYSDGSTGDVSDLATWQVSDRMGTGVGVLASARRGDVLGQAVGTAEVQADYTTLSARAQLLVEPAVLDSLTLLPEDASVAIGGTQTFVAQGTYSDGSKRDVSALVSWSSTDLGPTLGVATVSASGLATGKLRGVAQINAQYIGLRARAVLAVGLPAGDCAPLAWCWRNPSPHGDTQTGVWAADASNIWTISEHGLVTHYNGSRFLVQAALPGQRLTGIAGRDASHVTVVAEDDTLLRFDGTSWRRDSGSGPGASGLWQSAADRLWVGAPDGRIRVWSGSGWSAQSPPAAAGTRFLAVHGTAESNIWAVGDNHSVVQWDGTSWRDRRIAAASELVGVFGLDASRLWTVSRDGYVWQWNGSSWTWPIATSRGLRAIAGADARSLLAVGPGELLWFDGSSWSSVAGSLSDRLNAVYALDPRSFFAVGEGGSFYTWNGSSYAKKSLSLFEPRGSVNAIWSSDSRQVFAVGSAGKIVKWNGSVLTTQTSSTLVNLFAVWGSDENHVWASGQNGTIRFFDGTRWTAQSSGTLQYLYGLCGSASNDVWAVGSNGTLLHFDGAAWSAASSPTFAELNAIWCHSKNNVWAVGDDGALIRWDGSSWQAIPSGTAERLTAIYGLSATDIWVVGALGLIRHYDGSKWSTIPSGSPGGPPLDLLAVWAADPSRVYMAGEGGRLLEWDGTRIVDRSRDTSNTQTLRALRGTDLRNFWVGGDEGTLLQYAP